jgi:hypothetical protein
MYDDVTKANFRKATRDLRSYMLLCTKYLLDLKYYLKIFKYKGRFKLSNQRPQKLYVTMYKISSRP